MRCSDCLRIFENIGDSLNAPIETAEMLRSVSKSIVDTLGVQGCRFLMLGRDQSPLETIAFFGLTGGFIASGLTGIEAMADEVLQGGTVFVQDCQSDPRFDQLPAFREQGVRSLLMMPLRSRGQVIGAMHLTAAEPRVFCADELEILRVAAALCAGVIVRSMFQKILHDVSETIPLSLDLQDVLAQIVQVITEDLRAKGCLIRLLHPETGRLELWASYGLSQEYLNVGPRDSSKAAAETREGKAVAVYDAARYLQYPEEARREGIASLLSVPLLLHGHSIGVLRVYTRKPYEFSADEIHLMQMVAEQCTLLIRNAQLYSSVKERYDRLMVDFHSWFDQFYKPGGTPPKSAD
jgi:GAF domain-containing protein